MRRDFLILPLMGLSLVFITAAGFGRESDTGRKFGSQSPAAVRIDHSPITFGEQGKAIRIEARVEAPGRALIYMRVYYKGVGESSFRHRELRRAAHGYLGEIPGRHGRAPTMQYFLLALFNDQSVVSYPTVNPFGQPFEIMITEAEAEGRPGRRTGGAAKPDSKKSSGQKDANPSPPAAKKPPERISPQLLEKLRRLEAPRAEVTPNEQTGGAEGAGLGPAVGEPILIISPEPLSTVDQVEVLIAISFSPQARVDSSSVHVWLDNEEVTGFADISPLLVALDPGVLSPGEHQVSVTANDVAGQPAGSTSWKFRVQNGTRDADDEQDIRESRVSGVAFVEMRHEKFNGVSLDNNNLGGNLNGQYGPLNYSASMYLTSLESQAFQPRNRFLLSAGTRWLSFTLGDATPYFNDLVLWGRRVRGIQARLYTGVINIDFVKGETVRRVTPIQNLRSGTFRQSLIGIRPSLGGSSLQFGLTLLKARDDTTSIDGSIANAVPRDNLVLGADLLVAFDRHRFELKAAVAHSLVTNNISLPKISRAFIDSTYGVELPFDPNDYSDWLIINESTTPLDPSGLTALAYQINLRLNYFNQYINAGYKQIGSEYLTFGHTYLRNDIRGFYINDRWRLANNRVFLNLGLERYADHFNTVDGRPSTDLTTLQYGITINWSPVLPTLNFNFRNHNRDNGIDTLTTSHINVSSPDTTDSRLDNFTRDFMITMSYDFQFYDLDHTLSVSFTNSDRVDRWAGQRLNGMNSGEVASGLKSFTLRTRFRQPLVSTLRFATNDNSIGGQSGLFKYNLLGAQLEYTFPRSQVRAYFGVRRVAASGQNGTTNSPGMSVIDYTELGVRLGGSMVVADRHELVLDLDLLKYVDHGWFQDATGIHGNPSFTNGIFRLYYEYRL